MRRVHEMPFGASVTEHGVRFALWAPTAASVALVLNGEDMALPEAGEGWRESVVAQARAGDRYGFRVDGGLVAPDPASRFQPDDAHGTSLVVDPAAFAWGDADWRGLPWEDAVLYEAHVGTATPQGTYAALAEKLGYLKDLGVTALQLMPLADFPGRRGWGYDGVLPFAPEAAYGAPDDLKRLIDRAHGMGLMVMLDVVYNHFGPSGNYLHAYARSFFTERHPTPWGAGVNVDGRHARPVRDFLIHNALYWLEEYHFDGLRLDAVHEIRDDGGTHVLAELAERARAALPGREVHLVLENDANEARRLDRDAQGRPRHYTAQWNDDLHHAWHVVLTGEDEGYYADYAVATPRDASVMPALGAGIHEFAAFPHMDQVKEHVDGRAKPGHDEAYDNGASQDARHALAWLGRALAEGFAYQGEASPHRDGRPRGEPSGHLPPAAFISFLQNHDQVGNRAFGERLSHLAPPERLALARAALLLSPQPPMLFMGEEWSASTPFLYFVDFADDPGLSQAVRDGRMWEFGRFKAFADPASKARIPDPAAAETFEHSRLDWAEAEREPHRAALEDTRRLLALRRAHVRPVIASRFLGARCSQPASGALDVVWRYAGGTLRLVLNTAAAAPRSGVSLDGGHVVWASPGVRHGDDLTLPAWSAAFLRSA